MQAAGKLPRKQEQLIAVLLTEASIEAPAPQTGVNPVTVWRWMKQPGEGLAALLAYAQERMTLAEQEETRGLLGATDPP